MNMWLTYFKTLLTEERGDIAWPGGLLGVILVVLLILCAIVFLWMNVDVRTK